jgi:hypothetical protein
MRQIKYAVLLFLLSIFAYQPQLFAQNGGDEASEFWQQLPELTHKGVTISTGNIDFTDVVTSGPTAPISTSQITIVAWTWAFSDFATPTGTVVQICEVVSGVTTCLDVSNLPHGETTFFQNTPALKPVFFVTFKLPGTGGTDVFLQNTTQLIVNYNV